MRKKEESHLVQNKDFSQKVSSETINILFHLTFLIENTLFFLFFSCFFFCSFFFFFSFCLQLYILFYLVKAVVHKSGARGGAITEMLWNEKWAREIIAISWKHRITGSSNYWNNYSYKKYYVLSRNLYLKYRILKCQIQNLLRAEQLLKIFFLIQICSILRINFLL